MAKGDHLQVDTSYGRFIQHHGIDMGDGTVIHFKKAHIGALPIIMKTSMEEFSEGRVVTIIQHRFSLPPDKVVEIAEYILKLAEEGRLKQYDFWKFNCEHITNICKTGESVSYQVENTKEQISIYAPLIVALTTAGIIMATDK